MKSEPVISAQAIAAAVSAVIMLGLGMAVSLGWLVLNPDQMGAVQQFVTAVLGLAVLVGPQLVAAFWARRQVTPIADPKTPSGEPAAIVPVAQLQQLQAAAAPAMAMAPARAEAARPADGDDYTYPPVRTLNYSTQTGPEVIRADLAALRIELRTLSDEVEHMKLAVHKLLNPEGDDVI